MRNNVQKGMFFLTARDRRIEPPSRAGGGFASGMRSELPNTLRGNALKKVIKKKQSATWRVPPHPVRKAKSAEIEKFERKKTGARTGTRHVSWESCQLAAHARVGLSVGRCS